MINANALFSDETENFKSPYEPEMGDTVTLIFRTLKNDVLQAHAVINGVRHKMKKFLCDEQFDYYKYDFTLKNRHCNYYFTACDEDDSICYNRLGCVKQIDEKFNFAFTAGQKVPDWAKGAVFYQIYPDRFCNGTRTNDVTDNEYYYTGGHSRHVREWSKYPDELDVRCFYGGDLQGVKQKLDYLQDLGVEAIYFNPIFVSPSNHKYDTQDYDYIDPHLAIIEEDLDHSMQYWERHNGFAPKYIMRTTSRVNLEKSNQFFIDLVKEIHERGMRVIIDGVFNHCGSFHKWFDKEGIYLNKEGYKMGAYQSETSPYRRYFNFENSDLHSDYEGWWGYSTLPKLNYENSGRLEEYIWSLGAKWVSAPFNVDGWRLDVAADLGHSEQYNHKFWKNFHKRVRAANPEAFIFAEHYGSPESWLVKGEWDSVMNYDAFMEPVSWFLTGMEKHSEAFDGKKLYNGKVFFESMFTHMASFPRPALDSALNQLSNHDHSRFLTRTNRTVGTTRTKGPHEAAYNIDKRVMQLGVLIQMTWVGSPGIYYADEAGQVGWTDPDSRRTYPWGREDLNLINFHKAAIALRRRIPCLKMGSLKQLDAGMGYIAYGRFDKDECCAVVINCSDNLISLRVPVWEMGVPHSDADMEFCFSCGSWGFSTEGEKSDIKFGRLLVTLPEKSACVYRYSFKKDC